MKRRVKFFDAGRNLMGLSIVVVGAAQLVACTVSEPSNTNGGVPTEVPEPPPPNDHPWAQVEELDYHVPVGTGVMLDGTQSYDDDDDSLSYRWEVSGPEGYTLEDETSATPTFTPEERGSYRIRLIVNDGAEDSPSTNSDTSWIVSYGMTPLTGVTKLAAGWGHTAALMDDGSISAWGSNQWGQTGRGVHIVKDAIDLAAGEHRTVALTSEGTVVVWGRVGKSLATTECGNMPCATEPVEMSGLTDVTAIAARGTSVWALTADGSVYEWVTDWEQVTTDAKAVAVGVVVKSDGSLWTPDDRSDLESITDVVAVSSGHSSAGSTQRCALTADGSVWLLDPSARQAEGFTDAIAISGKGSACIAVRSDGTVWGLYGSTSNRKEGLSDVVAMAAGMAHIMVVKSDGTVWGWGSDSSGELGDGNYNVEAFASSPVQTVY